MAAYFGKEHRNILKRIREVQDQAAQNVAGWFEPVKVKQQAGFGDVEYPTYDMTRDGFTLLVMGFTGAKAMQFKLAYIKRFNEMEEQISNHNTPALPDFSDPAAAARAWADDPARVCSIQPTMTKSPV